MIKRYARKIGQYNGRTMYRVPVVVVLNNSQGPVDEWLNPGKSEFEVIAPSPIAAANWVRDQIASRPESEVYAFGPKGGETYRYIGWDSAIYSRMIGQVRRYIQLQLI